MRLRTCTVTLYMCVAIATATPGNTAVAADHDGSTFMEQFDKGSESAEWMSLAPSEMIAFVDKMVASAQDQDIPALTKAIGDNSKRARLGGLVLARLSQKNDKAFDALVVAAQAGNVHAISAIGVMKPESARKVGLALLKEKALPEIGATAADILSVVGNNDDVAALQKLIDAKPSRFIADLYQQALAELQFKLERVKTDDEKSKWEQTGLEYWYLRYAPHIVRSEAMSWWRVGRLASAGKWAVLPLDLLQYKIGRGDLLAIALAGHRHEPELIPILEKLARGTGDIGLLARWSLSSISSEEAVNACLRVSSSPGETEVQHLQLAKFAEENGGRSTLPVLEGLAKDTRLTDKERSIYGAAMKRLEQRLKAATTAPTSQSSSGEIDAGPSPAGDQ